MPPKQTRETIEQELKEAHMAALDAVSNDIVRQLVEQHSGSPQDMLSVVICAFGTVVGNLIYPEHIDGFVMEAAGQVKVIAKSIHVRRSRMS